jgi:hypothetical protein
MQTTRALADVSLGYEPPTITMHGTVAEVTGAQAVGAVTDAPFPAGTPLQDLTFSGV